MSDIMTVLQSTFERYARLKALYLILFICVLDVAAMGLYKELTIGRERELMFDCALAIASIVGLLTAMTAAFDIPRELREKTAQFILTKPMGRSSFVWGKFLGISLLCLFNIAIVTIGSCVVMQMKYGEIDFNLVKAAILVGGEAMMLTGAGVLFSMFLSDTIAAIGVFAVFALGHMAVMLPRIMDNTVGKLLYYGSPNLYNCDIKTEMSTGIEVSNAFIYTGLGFAICYSLAMIGLATVIFSRKDVS
ncbi:MAG: ABC transporter permease [Planctomycetota bacterium]|jgi:ABC-type transport system involved in multi-copper enzyme maturation permease subunit